jgi:hypothetical protein
MPESLFGIAVVWVCLASFPLHAAGVDASAEFSLLSQQIASCKTWNLERLKKEAYRPEALILETDKTPVDVVLRRTTALLKHLRSMPAGPGLKDEEVALDDLRAANRPELADGERRALFEKLITLRRQIAFRNPLLDFDKILFLKHDKMVRGERHMVDQYLGFNQSKRGGVYVLENPFSDNAKVASLLDGVAVANGRLKGRTLENQGSFISLELDWDAKYLYFAHTEAESGPYPEGGKEADLVTRFKNEGGAKAHGGAYYAFTPERQFQIMRLDPSTRELMALTDGSRNDFDPCVLPSGRIVFVSDRIGGNQRCGARYNSTYTLHAMMADGTDIIPLSYHETNEWHPSVDNNGMIIYTRWDYVDRDSDIAHHLWRCFPDGCDPRNNHGNYPRDRGARPWMELANRAIPGSHRYLSVAAPHHGENYGSLIMIDVSMPDDLSTSQIKRITPDVQFPEAENGPGIPGTGMKGGGRRGQVFGQPWPLSEDFYLCTYSPTERKHGIYLVDGFGNRIRLYDDPEIGCLDPMPYRPRTKPMEISVKTLQAKADQHGATEDRLAYGTVMIMNVYEADQPWPKDIAIKELRIVNLFPKPNSHLGVPRIGHADQSLARGVLGTVPVESDGSAHFKVPAGAAIYFQALDENGMMVQNMRSATYVHPGETLSCMGCHESKREVPKKQHAPLAFMREPSEIAPEVEGSYPLTFPRLVQPVLDAKCIACHDKDEKAPRLHGGRFVKGTGWSEGFATLQKYAWGKFGGNGALITKNKRSYSIPGQEGARVSALYQMLSKEHHDVKLTPEEMRRITLWIDCNSNFYGAYYDTEEQARGEVVKPLLGLPTYVPFERLKR